MFLGNGAPPETADSAPEGMGALEAAARQSRLWATYAPGVSRSEGLTLREAWERVLIELIENDPRGSWERIVEYLTTEEPPRPSAPIEGQWDLSWQEEFLMEVRLVADLTAYTDTSPGFLVGTREHLTEEGYDWQAVLDAEEPESLTAVPLDSEHLTQAVARRDYWKQNAENLARELWLWDPLPPPTEDYLYHLIQEAHDAYDRGIRALTGEVVSEGKQGAERASEGSTAERGQELVHTPTSQPTPDSTKPAPRESPTDTAARLAKAIAEHPESIDDLADDEGKGEHAWLTVEEVAGELRVHENTVRGYLRDGSIPSTKLGGVYRVARAALDEWMANGGKPRQEPKPLVLEDDLDYGF
ncbi:helix-turn-helix domain-containing protein [Citricoccus zhacaiensis]